MKKLLLVILSVVLALSMVIGCGDSTTPLTGVEGEVKSANGSFVVEKGDYVEMSKKAIWCLENQEQTNKMCQNARSFAEQNFDQTIINQKIFEVVSK